MRWKLIACCLTLAGAVSWMTPAMAEEDMAARVAALEKRVKELEAQTVLSLPELIVKEKKVYVCEKGHSFNKPQDGSKCPHDGSKVSVQKTYQKEKYYRRKSIEDKIEEALASIQPIGIGISATGLLSGTIGTGKTVASKAKNDLFASGSLDIGVTAKPASQTFLCIDLEALSDTGAGLRVPSLTSLNSDANRLTGPTQNEQVKVREAWISTIFGKSREWTFTAGSMDLVSIFDQNNVANNETLQFVSDAFVNNPFIAPPANGAAAAVVYDPKGPYALKFAVMRPQPNLGANGIGGGKKLGDTMWVAAEVDIRARPLQGLQNGVYRFWIRSNGEMDKRVNIAYGVSFDQKLNRAVTFFGRYGNRRTQSTVDANGKPVVPTRDDLHYSFGLEFRGPELTFLPRDMWAAAYSRTTVRSVKGQELTNGGVGETEGLFEAYYKFFITDHFHATPFVQWLQDSTRAELAKADDLILGLRTQVDF